MSVVLDASAVLAMMFDEPGGEHVWRSARGACLSTVNLVEILNKVTSRSIAASHVLIQMHRLGINVEPFSMDEARIAANLTQTMRAFDLCFADRACLALGLSRKLPVLTANPGWAALNIGVDIVVIG